MNRRGFLGAILAACAIPYVVSSGVLMPVRALRAPTGWAAWETIYLPPFVSASDPYAQRGYLGVKGMFKGRQYGIASIVSDPLSVNSLEYRRLCDALMGDLMRSV